MSFRLLTIEALLAQCREDHYRGSGPGGQKRNKTSNGVRLVHEPTGIIVTATEARSLKENRIHAIHRLQLKLATEIREPIDLVAFTPPNWFLTLRHGTRVEVSHHHSLYTATVGLVLDLVAATHGNPAAVAANLGISTSAVIRLLDSDPHVWTVANRVRADMGMGPLTHRG